MFRTGYGITYNGMPWSRPLRGQYPAMIGATFQNANQFQGFGSLATGIPYIPDARHRQRQVPAAELGARPGRRKWATSTAPASSRGTSPSSGACRGTSRSTWPTSPIAATAATRTSTSTRRRSSAAATPAVPTARVGRTVRLDLWGQRLKTRYQRAADRREPAVHQGPAAQGRLHAGQGQELRHRRRRLDGPGVQHAEPARARTTPTPATTAVTTSRWGSCISCPGRAAAGGNPLRLIINDWQLNGVVRHVQRPAVQRHRQRLRDFNTPGRTWPRPTRSATVNARRRDRRQRASTTIRAAWARPALRTLGNTERNQFYGPGGVNVDASIFRGFPIGGTKRIEFRLEAANITNTPKFDNPERRRDERQLHAHHAAGRAATTTRQIQTGTPLPVLARARATRRGPGRTFLRRALRLYSSRAIALMGLDG